MKAPHCGAFRVTGLTTLGVWTNVLARYYIDTMKTRPDPVREKASDASLKALARALAALDKPQEVQAFLRDLCTPAELEAMADRWRVVPLLRKGVPYREIYDLTGVSVTTIGRVARSLEHGAGGYAVAIERLSTRKTESN